MESKEVSKNKKQELKRIYESLNPAQLKRDIDRKLNIVEPLALKEKCLTAKAHQGIPRPPPLATNVARARRGLE